MALSQSTKDILIVAMANRSAANELSAAVDAASPPSNAIVADGSVSFSADQGMGGNKIVDLANGTASDDAMAFGQIKEFDSAASVGGGASEALVITGLLASDVLLSVSQKVAGGNSLPLLGWTTQANDALTVQWSADPGAGAIVRVAVKR